MTKSEYAQQRLDPRWQRTRLEILNRDEFHCRDCWNDSDTLNVHHLYYVKDRLPWDYPPWAMVTLCRKCHKRRTELGSSSELQPFETVLHLMTVGGVPGLLDELFEALTLPDPEDVHENGWHTVVSAIKDRFPPVPPRQNQTQTQTQKQTKGVTPPVTQALHKRSKGSK